jgi:exopolysaccharide biosynthesis polyprenyl glycosylphosphotransferase
MSFNNRLSRRLFLTDLALPALGFYLGTLLRKELPYGEATNMVSADPTLQVYLIVMASWILSLLVHGVYEPERVLRWYSETTKVMAASLMATVLVAGVFYLTRIELSRLQFGYALIITVALLLGVRFAMRTWHRLVGFRTPNTSVRILVVGTGALGKQTAAVLETYKRWGYELVGFLADSLDEADGAMAPAARLGTISELERMVTEYRIDDVWIALQDGSRETVRSVVERLATLPVRVHLVPDYGALALVAARPASSEGLPVIALRAPVITGTPRILKRGFDIVVSLGALVVTAPLMAVLAALIRLDSRGPVIFRQERVGENGRIFRMFKFRTMTAGAEPLEQHFENETDISAIDHKQRFDPRITRLGRLLRRYSLDELPQLYNVLRGDMSLVGPRPELPWLVAKYDPSQRRRLAVPQGITGWWQVTGRSDKPMHRHTDEDLHYVYHYSLWLDVQILAKTLKVVIRGDGAF